MIEVHDLDLRKLTRNLLREAGAPLGVRTFGSGNIDDIQEEKGEDGIRAAHVCLSEVASLEDEAFPTGELIETREMTPEGGDSYRTSMVVTFADVVKDHVVVLVGDHSGAGVSDDSHEAYFNGWLEIVPVARSAERVEVATRRIARDAVHDLAGRLDAVILEMSRHGREDLEEAGFVEKAGRINRMLA